MTPQRAKELLPIITAFANGETIQARLKNDLDEWEDCYPTFNDSIDYRIKPEPDPYAELKAAHAAGKVIQIISTNGLTEWYDCTPNWEASPESYRIKPTPKLVPLTSDDLPPVVWVRSVSEDKACLVTSATKHRLYFPSFNLHLDKSMESWQWSPDRKTWHSFMKEVEA